VGQYFRVASERHFFKKKIGQKFLAKKKSAKDGRQTPWRTALLMAILTPDHSEILPNLAGKKELIGVRIFKNMTLGICPHPPIFSINYFIYQAKI